MGAIRDTSDGLRGSAVGAALTEAQPTLIGVITQHPVSSQLRPPGRAPSLPPLPTGLMFCWCLAPNEMSPGCCLPAENWVRRREC